MLCGLKLSIEYTAMVDDDRSYLIIRDEDENTVDVQTGVKATESAAKISELITKIFNREEA